MQCNRLWHLQIQYILGSRLQVHGRPGFTSKLGSFAVSATADSRQPRDVRGRVLSIRFEIRDPVPVGGNQTNGPYQVAVAYRVSGLDSSF